ncbi:MAG: hypothetical protein Q4G59_06105, partial [Planctomycetia bacterium]|nr:hypothetical protein [Planctomycetia bacterium]
SDSKAKAFDVSVQLRCRKTTLAEYYTVDLKSETDQDRALSFHFVERLGQGELVWFDHPRLSKKMEAPSEYVNAGINPVGSSGRLSRYPLGAVGCDKQGVAIGISPDWPAFFRVGSQSAFRELYIGYDIALTKEKPTAQLRFVRYTFDPAFGFRAALAKYYQIFPKAFECRIPDQGVWMPFYKISKVEKPEDFGFRFKEGNDEVAYDDAHNVLTFRYTEPMTWWMSMPKDMPRTIDAALEQAKKLAAKGDKRAQSFLTCGHYDQGGNFSARLLDTPWCNGAVWSICDLPGLDKLARAGKLTGSDKYPLSSYEVRWSDKIADDLYPASNPGTKGLDGEYIDSSEGYITALLNFRREHFAATRCPLTYDRDSFEPAILRGLISYEYAKVMSDAVHAKGKLMMANSTPGNLFWLAPVLDVCGTETNWNHKGKWKPQSDADLLYRRAMCGPKPYCFLMNTNFDDFSYECSEKFMKRSLAYGLYPGYFSADAATGHYFSRPELYNRDRPLFKKYIPLCKRVAEAGWQPLTGATSSVEKVYIERFGVKADRVCFTLFNDSDKAETTTVTLDAAQLKTLDCTTLTDLVSGKKIELKNGSFNWTLGPEDVAVFAK